MGVSTHDTFVIFSFFIFFLFHWDYLLFLYLSRLNLTVDLYSGHL